MSFQVGLVNANLGALSNGTRPVLKVPSAANGGGISIYAASIVQGGTAASSLTLVYLDSSGTVVQGTIAAAIGGTASTFTANTPKDFTISTAFVEAGKWIGVTEGNVAVCNVVTDLVLQYAMGKA